MSSLQPFLKAVVAAAVPFIGAVASFIAAGGKFDATTIGGLIVAAVGGAGTYLVRNKPAPPASGPVPPKPAA